MHVPFELELPDSPIPPGASPLLLRLALGARGVQDLWATHGWHSFWMGFVSSSILLLLLFSLSANPRGRTHGSDER